MATKKKRAKRSTFDRKKYDATHKRMSHHEKYVIELGLRQNTQSQLIEELTERVDSIMQRSNFQQSQHDAERKSLRDEMNRYRQEMELSRETRGDAEIMFLRKLVMVLFDGKPNTDAFLDRLGDVAHLFADNVETLDTARGEPYGPNATPPPIAKDET